jgi:5-oxoprolinase (ATP-hydrolysing)
VGIGIVGMVRTEVAATHTRVIGFDMGGPSTDVSPYASEFECAFETLVAGVRMRANDEHPRRGRGRRIDLAVRRHAAVRGPRERGCQSRAGELRRSGPLAVTDASMMLVRIQLDWFPRVFGPDADEPLLQHGQARRVGVDHHDDVALGDQPLGRLSAGSRRCSRRRTRRRG